MKRLAISFGLLISGCSFTTAWAADTCGTITIAAMNWQAAEFGAELDKLILNEGYDCDAELVPGDTMLTITTMAEKGQPDIAPQIAANAVGAVLDQALEDGSLYQASQAISDGAPEGFWIPQYIADANPDIKTIADALARPDLFPDKEDPSKGALHNCPVGWNCAITTANMFEAFDAESLGFKLVDTGSGAGLDGTIARAYENQQGWLGYYWAPTSILKKYPMTLLDPGYPHEPDTWANCMTQENCATAKPNAWPLVEVYTITTTAFSERGGPAFDYVNQRSLTSDQLSEVLLWMTDNQATGLDAAKYFLQHNKDIWASWVSPEAVTKIEASIY